VLPLNKFLRSANSSYDSRFAQQNLAFFAPAPEWIRAPHVM
jgi:hypothetical protein